MYFNDNIIFILLWSWFNLTLIVNMVYYVNTFFKKVLLVKMFQFLNKQNLLFEDEFDFRKGKSTVDIVVCLADMVLDGLEYRNFTINVFLTYLKNYITLTMLKY